MKNRRKNWMGCILKTAAVVVGLYLGATYLSLRTELEEAQAEYELLRASHALEQQKTAELEDLVEGGITDRYVINVAQQKGYILPGEHVFVDIYGQ